ncbi:hypothetical protein [Salinirubrum litoreum]|uniref:Uncharacterized protein n=1 Tax=Salinirubrum litoreum TaxID=1126234 RepID=A0ABD5R8V3_9EURY|nr:hypothetical protein [Salinirubrum litoreum]
MRIDTLPGFRPGTPKRNALVLLLYSLLLFVAAATSDLLPKLLVP